jgi:hypothetical protein
MSDVLDRAFESLTRDLAHSPGPGAAAAMSTARTRRRTKVGAVALAALVVVGGGLAAPRLLSPEDGVAAGSGSARFDKVALSRATEGWITDWEDWERYSPWGGGGFSTAGCSDVGGPGGESAPEPASTGGSRFVSHSGASAVLVVQEFADAERASSAHDLSSPAPDTCGTTTIYDVDGVHVRHDSIPQEGGTPLMWLGDIWSVRIGADRAELQLVNDTGVADDATAEDVAEALVAGLRDGWTQSGMETVPPAGPQTPQLPELPEKDLTRALAGWRGAARTSASGVPNTPCLGLSVSTGTVASSRSGTPHGVTYELGGYDGGQSGAERIAAMVEELRTCDDFSMEVTELGDGVVLATYDYGGPDGHGALWLAARGDRAGAVGVDGAAGPIPAGVDVAVAGVLDDWLSLSWR